MLKKTIKFEDYNGEQRSGVYYFNLTKSELTRWNFDHPEGIVPYMRKLMKENNYREILRVFEDLISMAYGVPDEDGLHFRKSKALVEDFEDSPAYDELFMELVNDAEKFEAFVTALVPRDLAEEIRKQQAEEAKKHALDHDTGTKTVE